MKVIERVVESLGEPGSHDLWLRTSNKGGGSAELLVNLAGEWKKVNPLLAAEEFSESEKKAMRDALGVTTILEEIVDSLPPVGMVVTITNEDLEGEITQKRHDEILCAAILQYAGYSFVQLAPTIQQIQQLESGLGDNADIELVFGSGVEFDGDSAAVATFLILYNEGVKFYLASQDI